MTRAVLARGVGLGVAVALGAVGIWFMITSSDTKVARIGMLAVLWGLLIGAFAAFGSRRPAHEDEPPAQFAQQPPTAPAPSRAELELRSRAAEVERAEEAARRREYEERLEQMLRREVQATVAREVAALREEIARLRGELLEQVGGQLRLERIETTRVIGSDLEALQHELRELKQAAAREASEAAMRARLTETTATISRIVEPARVRPVSREAAEAGADVQLQNPNAGPSLAEPDPRRRPEPIRVEAVRSDPIRPGTQWRIESVPAGRPEAARSSAVHPPTAGIPTIAPSTPSVPSVPPAPPAAASAAGPTTPPPPPAPAPAAEARPAPAPNGDPFAGLPRIRPFTDFELDPIDDDERTPYTGRRRRDEEALASGGRHASGDAAEPAEPPAGRRRAPENGDDLLARLLARESSPR